MDLTTYRYTFSPHPQPLSQKATVYTQVEMKP